MTEEQAKTKWCPFARTIFGKHGDDGKFNVLAQQAVFNRYTMDNDDQAIPGGAVCIGSACMAWRWFQSTKEQGEMTPPYEGYCGIAGKP